MWVGLWVDFFEVFCYGGVRVVYWGFEEIFFTWVHARARERWSLGSFNLPTFMKPFLQKKSVSKFRCFALS